MHRTVTRVMVFAFLLAAACSGKQKVDESGRSEPLMVLTENGFDGLASTQKINAIAIAQAFPDLEVDSDGFGKRYAVRKGGNTLALIEPTGDMGYRAKVLGADVKGPRGIRVGDPYQTISAFDDLQCRRGGGEWASQIYCTTIELRGIVFGFDGATIDTGDCTSECALPTTGMLTGASIRMIDWQP